jgi:hypothetical protein
LFKEHAMDAAAPGFEEACQQHLDRFFVQWPNALLQERANKVLRLLRASPKPLQGKTQGWAAAIIYFAATDGTIPCGVPGVSNAEFAAFMGVAMETARRRSGQVRDIVLF